TENHPGGQNDKQPARAEVNAKRKPRLEPAESRTMRFYVGDEAGAKQSDESVAETKVEVWGAVDKKREVQFLKLVTPTGTERRKVVGVDNRACAEHYRPAAPGCGLVECVDAKDGSRISEIRQQDVDGSASKFVGLEVDQDGNVITCTSTGMFTFYPFLARAEGPTPALPIRRFDTKQTDLVRMRAWFPSNGEADGARKRVFATGGKEKEMCVWDLDA
ncbi:MAG: hypothetical protein BJ554DRAFT_3787, partial [Olpidium bornovanus]